MLKRFLIGVSIIVFVPTAILLIGTKFVAMHKVKVQLRDNTSNWNSHEIAVKYAPVLYQELHKNSLYAHWDYICALNFDEDWNPLNNSENLEKGKFSLEACLYYSVVESETHFFISYSLFHPLDWNYTDDGRLRKWYENSMRHLQVVVEKESRDSIGGNVILLALQKTREFEVYKKQGVDVYNRKKYLADGELIFCDRQGHITKSGDHVVLFIETGTHSLSLVSQKMGSLIQKKNTYVLPRGVQYVPNPEEGGSPVPGKSFQVVHYSLTDISSTLWAPNVPNSEDIQNFFKADNFVYNDHLMNLGKIPLYLQGKDLEGTTYNLYNPNISPFALGLGNNQGCFFFNPIEAYRKNFVVSDWSLTYLFHPYWEEN